MNNFKEILIAVLIVVGILAVAICPMLILSHYNHVENELTVSGTVFAKGTEDHVHKHSSDTHWVICVKPDNPSYEMFDVDLSFAQYCKYDVGDKCSFVVDKSKVGLERNEIFHALLISWVFLIVSGLIIMLSGAFYISLAR